MLYIIIGLFCILLLLLFFSKIIISVQYTYEQNEQQLTFSIFILGIRIFKRKQDLTARDSKLPAFGDISFRSLPEKIKEFHSYLNEINRTMEGVLQKVRLHHFKWITTGGTGDAFTTGMASAGVWTVKGMVTGFFMRRFQVKCKPFIHVEPNFQQRFLHSEVDCMVSMRLGQAMYTFIKLGKMNMTLPNNKEDKYDRRTSH
ncbi:DUF2953 domain-containing protein [Oceanobacillus massiliensis]|uniref:DUF2953 domain-containing protein n=1 Tax=Oceanobacillus massiliensis TaxID=1465765 RepID=UPI00301B5777